MVGLDRELSDLLIFLATEKSTAVNRMQTSFNWAFGVLTVFVVGVVTRPGFPGSYLSFFLLNIALVLLSHFFVRTAKDYLNQIRFAGLEKHCLACLIGLEIERETIQKDTVARHFDKYFIQWKSPKPLSNVIKKTLIDHGYMALYAVLLTLLIWVGTRMEWNDARPVCTLLVVGVFEGFIFRDFGGFYFRCDAEEESMKGMD